MSGGLGAQVRPWGERNCRAEPTLHSAAVVTPVPRGWLQLSTEGVMARKTPWADSSMKLLVPSVWSISENLSLWSGGTISAEPASSSAERNQV